MKKRKGKYHEVFRWKGHRFYIPPSPNDLPTARALGFWTAIREYTLHITFDDLEVMTRRLKQAINDSDLATAGYLVSTLEAYRQLDASKNTTFNVAQYYIFLDKEGDKLTDEWKEKKRDLFDRYPEVQAFFLNTTQGLLTALKILSEDIQIEDYLLRSFCLEDHLPVQKYQKALLLHPLHLQVISVLCCPIILAYLFFIVCPLYFF